MIPEEIYDKIIRHAVKAPSQLNSQPWRFEVEKGVIHLLPDFSRSLHAIDPCNTNLYISMGGVLENLLLASRQLGYKPIADIKKLPLFTMVSIRLYEEGKPDPLGLFDQIDNRQVIRAKFAPVELNEILIKKFCAESAQDGISIIPLMQQEGCRQIIPLVSKSIQILYNQRAYVKEKVRWIRFNEKQAMLTGDGIRSVSIGLPFSGTWFGRLCLSRQFSELNEVKRWSKLINYSSGLVLLTAKDSQPEQWIKLGISLQQFVLNLSHVGIQYSHVPIPMEYILIQKQLAELFGAEGNVPLQLIRIGKGKPMPYSFRRNIVHSVTHNF